jgi:hypothetical protein
MKDPIPVIGISMSRFVRPSAVASGKPNRATHVVGLVRYRSVRDYLQEVRVWQTFMYSTHATKSCCGCSVGPEYRVIVAVVYCMI